MMMITPEMREWSEDNMIPINKLEGLWKLFYAKARELYEHNGISF